MLKDISNFDNVNDYLPILNGALISDIIIILLIHVGFFKSKLLKDWYLKLNFLAVVADVLIIVIGFVITRYLYGRFFKKYSFLKFLILFLIVQIVHDVGFYLIFKNFPKGKNYVFDLFKKYAEEVGGGAILGDSFMIFTTTLFASYLAGFNLNTNIIIFIVSFYLIPYLIYF